MTILPQWQLQIASSTHFTRTSRLVILKEFKMFWQGQMRGLLFVLNPDTESIKPRETGVLPDQG